MRVKFETSSDLSPSFRYSIYLKIQYYFEPGETNGTARMILFKNHSRTWLNDNVGKEYIDWYLNISESKIWFAKHDYAALFKLRFNDENF